MPFVLALTGLHLCLPVSGIQSLAGACGSVRRRPSNLGSRQLDRLVPPFRCRMHQRDSLLNSCTLHSAWARALSCNGCRVRLLPPGTSPCISARAVPPKRALRRPLGTPLLPTQRGRLRAARRSPRPSPPVLPPSPRPSAPRRAGRPTAVQFRNQARNRAIKEALVPVSVRLALVREIGQDGREVWILGGGVNQTRRPA